MATNMRNRRRGAARGGQRERLVEAMTQVAGRHGYREASVARVLDHAGVSRATFYQHFEDKEDCFLAAFDAAAQRIFADLRRIDEEVAPGRRAAELIDDLLVNVVASPAAARILMIEGLAGGPRVRRAQEGLVLELQGILERWLCQPDAEGNRLAISGRAAMGGVGGVMVVRAFRGETADLGSLRNDLLAWIGAHAIPDGVRRPSPAEWRALGASLVGEVPAATPLARRRLPRGRAALDPQAVAAEKRERILVAVAQLARTKGYSAMTVADVVRAAAVTRESFYALFKSKEDAFLATQIAGLETAISFTAGGFFVGSSWPDRVWGGLRALLGHVSEQPDLVYLDVIETYSAGEAAIRRSFDNIRAYHLFLEDGYRQTPAAVALPRICSDTIGSAVLELLRWQVSEGRTERTLEALPEVAYLALAPFIGPREAMALVEEKVAAASAGSHS